MTPAPIVDTKRVTNRRTVAIKTPDDLLAEVDRLISADRAGTLTLRGNWTLGQTLGHLAAWIDYGFDGFPTTPPLIIRIVLRLMKSRFFGDKPMPAGVRIPGIKAGTHATERLPLADGERKFRAAVSRLKAGPPRGPHPIFGPLSHDEWWAMHLGHARLHLSFMET